MNWIIAGYILTGLIFWLCLVWFEDDGAVTVWALTWGIMMCVMGWPLFTIIWLCTMEGNKVLFSIKTKRKISTP